MITPVIRSCRSPVRWKIGPATISNRPGEEQAPAGRLATIGDQQDEPGDDQHPAAERQCLRESHAPSVPGAFATGRAGDDHRVRALLGLLILTVAAPAAHAASYSVPARGATPELTGSTVALAAGQVVWVEERGTGAALVAAGEDGSRATSPRCRP